METKRLNPLSSKDWQYCFGNVPDSRARKVATIVLSVAMGFLIIASFSDILNAIPDGADEKGLGSALFGVSLITGALAVGCLITNLYMAITAAVFFMVRGKRAPDQDVDFEQAHGEYAGQPVTAALAEALQPQEAAGVYEVDCSLTLACSECGKELCPGCRDNCIVSLFMGKAYVWCKDCTDADSKHQVKEAIRYYRQAGVSPE